MSSHEISDELLQAWMDGEAGVETARVEAYVERHPEATARIEELQRAAGLMRELIDEALGPVEPLAGMAAIRERIREREESRWQNRLSAWWQDVWMFNRGAVVGVALAAFAGVVAAPAVLWLMAEEEGVEYRSSPSIAEVAPEAGGDSLYAPAGISIESLEVGGNGSARVMDAGETTLIWVEGDDSQLEDDGAISGEEP